MTMTTCEPETFLNMTRSLNQHNYTVII